MICIPERYGGGWHRTYIHHIASTVFMYQLDHYSLVTKLLPNFRFYFITVRKVPRNSLWNICTGSLDLGFWYHVIWGTLFGSEDLAGLKWIKMEHYLDLRISTHVGKLSQWEFNLLHIHSESSGFLLHLLENPCRNGKEACVWNGPLVTASRGS